MVYLKVRMSEYVYTSEQDRDYASYRNSGIHLEHLKPSIIARLRSPGLSPASGFEHPASTLPTRFPAALGIGHGLPAA